MSYEPTGLALEIFQSRHAAHSQETWLEGGQRVALHVSNAETGAARTKWCDEFRQALQDNTFMPGGRVWYGAGRARGQMLNCFVTPTSDSREGWGRTLSDTIIISGTGGGVGINFSPTRPRGSAINGTGGTATGAVSEMEMVNAVGNVIKAGGGRRVALMFGLSLNHGDILEFIDKKLDRNELNNANVSIIFDDDPEEFFKLVREDGTWDLKHNGKVVATVSARQLWERLVENAIKPRVGQGGGEPGLLNRFLANKMSNIWYIEPLECTNPCQPGWATVLTPGGIRTISEIGVGSVIWSGQRWTTVIRKVHTGIKKVKAFRTRAGIFYGTENHRVVQNGVKVEAKDAEGIDLNVGPYPTNVADDPHVLSEGLSFALSDTQANIPSGIWKASTSVKVNFLRGLYWQNGIVKSDRVTLSAKNLNTIEIVQVMLSSVGIDSHYFTYSNSFELIISSSIGRQRFARLIGFIDEERNTYLRSTIVYTTRVKDPNTIYEITDVEDISEEDVYDITVDAPEHTYWTGGVLVSNCGEIWLSPYDCCCLGHVVLPRFIDNGKLQWDRLKHVVSTGVRFLDDVLTVNQYPLPEIAQKCSQIRRIGLGVTGLHHMLLELGLQYNAPSGLEFVDKLMAFIKNASYEASSDIAAEKGSFPGFDSEKYLQGKFIKTLKPSIRQKIVKQGMRNCAVNTIAPVGTGSMVCNTSSGIEPIFAVGYRRKFRRGDELAEEIVLDPLFTKGVEEGRDTSHFLGAHELSMRDHFEMQRVCQRHIDNATSKTINLPKGVSAQALSDLYMEYLPDLKGVTVYPDGSREDQPLTPLTREEALKLAQQSVAMEQSATMDSCRNGVCEL